LIERPEYRFGCDCKFCRAIREGDRLVIEKLNQETINDGLEHPFVRAVLKELRQRHAEMLERLERVGADGSSQASYMYCLAGRASEIRLLIDDIETAKGMHEE
jgi:hypothetical protein